MATFDQIGYMAETIHRVSTEHGFTPPSSENLPEKLMLSVSELAEALEAHRDEQEEVYFVYKSTDRMPIMEHSYSDGNVVFLKNDGSEWGTWTMEQAVDAGWFEAKPEGVLVEIADSIIRNLHMMHSLMHDEKGRQISRYSISEILRMKIDYNSTRPFKHGRSY